MNVLNVISLILEQNATEKRLSMIGLIIMGILLFVLVLDSTARYKSEYVPKSRSVKVFTWVLFFLVFIAIFVLLKIYNN